MKPDNKPLFRSLAKQAAYDALDRQLKSAQKKLRDNKWEIAQLARAQNQLKSDVSALHQCMHEIFGKKKESAK